MVGKSPYPELNPNINAYASIRLDGKTPDSLALQPNCYLHAVLTTEEHSSFIDDASRANLFIINTEILGENSKQSGLNNFLQKLPPEQYNTIKRINVFVGIADDFPVSSFLTFEQQYLHVHIAYIFPGIVRVKVVSSGSGLYCARPKRNKVYITSPVATFPDVSYTTEIIILKSGSYTIGEHKIVLYNNKLINQMSLLKQYF